VWAIYWEEETIAPGEIEACLRPGNIDL